MQLGQGWALPAQQEQQAQRLLVLAQVQPLQQAQASQSPRQVQVRALVQEQALPQVLALVPLQAQEPALRRAQAPQLLLLQAQGQLPVQPQPQPQARGQVLMLREQEQQAQSRRRRVRPRALGRQQALAATQEAAQGQACLPLQGLVRLLLRPGSALAPAQRCWPQPRSRDASPPERKAAQ